jgi:hypothetical protein
MPSTRIANEIRQSLVPGESAEDAEFLFDRLFELRRNLDLSKWDNEQITGAVLCFLFPAKPQKYKEEMRAFRLRFHGIASQPRLQQEFRASILPRALTLRETDLTKVQWSASEFFKQQARSAGEGYR